MPSHQSKLSPSSASVSDCTRQLSPTCYDARLALYSVFFYSLCKAGAKSQLGKDLVHGLNAMILTNFSLTHGS